MTVKAASRRRWTTWLAVGSTVLLLPTVGAGAAAATGSVPGPVGDAPHQAEPCTDVEDERCHGEFAVADGYAIPYYSSYSLDGTEAATHAVIVLHGSGGRYHDSFDSMVAATELEGDQRLEDTLIVSPRFTNDDQDPGDGEAFWDGSSWKSGDAAVEPAGLSAFAVMDRLVETLADSERFPNLRTVTLAGHSGGGQFSGRWAIASRTLDTLSGLQVRIVVSNPSSYLYLDEYRPNLDDPDGPEFVIPDVDCDYNAYQYGLEGIADHPYLAGSDPSELRQRFVAQDVHYLLGEDDTGDDAEQSCEAMAQGEHRFERGTRYFDWVRHSLPAAEHTLLTVPDAGHDENEVYPSQQGRQALFRGF